MITSPSTPKPRSRLLIALGASAIVACLILTGLVARMDQWLYDRLSPLVAEEADNRIAIVAIDEKSLGELGRWPWSRRQHARLIDELGRIGVRGIGLDLLLSEPALFDPEGDALLARAMSRHGKVVLPVLAEATQVNGPLVELLPIPEFSASVASLGHVDLATDDDGVVRSAYLRAGQGSPRWPALALALSQLDQPLPQNDDLPGERLSDQAQVSPQRWVRDHRVLIPYARPPNGFPQVSYTDVIHQRIPASLLQGRWILVGTTAMGMGDTVKAPGQGGGRGLTGVEYEANVLNMLIQGNAITPMSLGGQLLLSVLLVSLPMLLCGFPVFRQIWRPALATIVLTLLLSLLLLQFARLWFPASATLLVLAIGASVWVYRLIRRTQRAAQTDPLTGLANRNKFNHALEQELRAIQRTHLPMSLLLLDIDHFKQLNDSQGHASGDAVLRLLARVLRGRARRPRDVIARLGGDEFAVLLPETSAQAAATIATTIHVDLANLAARTERALDAPPFTASIGIHTTQAGDNLDAAEVFERADAALYQAKQSGRNRSVSHAIATP
ncbi:CHASE2 domain-containing protein [Pseudoxanthomonas beigongshangi]